MPAVEVKKVNKTYGNKRVVNDVSFALEPGEILGLIGPNGAGKTTTIRMMMDIIKPDTGEVLILGQSMGEEAKNRIGYLPEERGLYRKVSINDTLRYLASLKGVPANLADERATSLLKRVSMDVHQGKKIEELSRGMGQIIQFLATIIHDPELLILDEPFQGLDPVNTELLRDIILELRGRGKAIILSTHRMNEVEELCDRIFMIDQGKGVLAGNLNEIKSKYRNNSIFVEFDGDIDSLEGVISSKDMGDYTELFLNENTKPQEILKQFISRQGELHRFEVSTPSLHEIFLKVVAQRK